MFMGEKDRDAKAVGAGGGAENLAGMSIHSLGHHIEYLGLNGKVLVRCNQRTNIYSEKPLDFPGRKVAVCNEGHSKKREDLEFRVIG